MCGSYAGKIRLSKQTWVSEGTVNIRNGRHVILQAGDCNLQPLSSSQLNLIPNLLPSVSASTTQRCYFWKGYPHVQCLCIT